MTELAIHFLHIYFWVYICVLLLNVFTYDKDEYAKKENKGLGVVGVIGLSIFILSCYY